MSCTPRAAACARSAAHSRSKRTWLDSHALLPNESPKPSTTRAWRGTRRFSRPLRPPRSGLREQPVPGGERRPRLYGEPCRSGGPERQHLPHRLARLRQPVDELVRRRAEAGAGQGGGMQLDAALGARELTHRRPAPRFRLRPNRAAFATRRVPPRSRAARGPAARADPHRAPVSRWSTTAASRPSAASGTPSGVRGRLPRWPRGLARRRPIPGPRRPGVARGPAHALDAHVGATAGRARSGSARSATGRGRSRPGRTFAAWREELDRKIAFGEEDLAGELAEGAVMREAAAGRPRGRGRKTISTR